ncbi:MAG: DUF2170 family protein [Aliishimia sp.]
MTNEMTAWTATELQDALNSASSDTGVKCQQLGDTNVLEVTLSEAGDFVLHVNVGETQILTSAVLWARDEQADPDAFEAMMLRSHKSLLPLCALSIDQIDGREYYELFGAMSCQTPIDDVLNEFTSIAQSALELASDIGPGKTQSGDAS